MTTISTRKTIRSSAQRIYNVIIDVDKYPNFVPFCQNIIVLSDTIDGSIHVKIAKMTVGHAAIRESYITKIIGNRDSMIISLSSSDGPIKEMSGQWVLNVIDGDLTEVIFDLSYKFRNPIAGALFGKFFGIAFGQITAAFERRAAITDRQRGDI